MSRSSKFLKVFAISYLIFLYAPALLLPIFSFNSSQIISFPLTGFTTYWFERLLYQETLHEAFKNKILLNTLYFLIISKVSCLKLNGQTIITVSK